MSKYFEVSYHGNPDSVNTYLTGCGLNFNSKRVIGNKLLMKLPNDQSASLTAIVNPESGINIEQVIIVLTY
jgi:hypothetical protein